MRFSTFALIAFLPLAAPTAQACPKLAGEYVVCGAQGTKSAERLTVTQLESDGVTSYRFLTQRPGVTDTTGDEVADGKGRTERLTAKETAQYGYEVLQRTAACDARTLSVTLETFGRSTDEHPSSRVSYDYSVLYSADGPILVQKTSGRTDPDRTRQGGDWGKSDFVRHYARDAAACDAFARIVSDLKNRGN